MKTNVLLVDGRKLTREGLAVLLGKHADIHVVGEADHTQAAIKLARAVSAHVVIYIVSALTATAVDLIRSLRSGRGETKIIVLLNHSSPAMIREVFDAGASGCMTRECASEELVAAIRSVRGGKTYMSARVADAIVNNYVLTRPRGRDPLLSQREKEILQRLANGESTKEMARQLSVSTKTVETYRRRLMEKLQIRTVAELTKYALVQGLTSLELPAQG